MSKLGLSSLRELFARTDGPEGFEHLPEHLEYILMGLNEADPAFRADIHALLFTTVELCYALSNQTYDSRRAAGSCSHLHAIAARLMLHLMLRPSRSAYGILFPRTGTLHEDIYTSEQEAVGKLDGLHRLGLRETGEVVQVTVTSTKQAQPRAQQSPTAEVVALAQKLDEEMK